MDAIVDSSVRGPNGAMNDAYHALSRGCFSGESEKANLMGQLLSGTNAALAYLALNRLNLSPEQITKLCQVIAKGGDGLIVLWALKSVSKLSVRDRQILRESLVTINLHFIALTALGQTGDHKVDDLTESQRTKLERIAVGLPAKE